MKRVIINVTVEMFVRLFGLFALRLTGGRTELLRHLIECEHGSTDLVEAECLVKVQLRQMFETLGVLERAQMDPVCAQQGT